MGQESKPTTAVKGQPVKTTKATKPSKKNDDDDENFEEAPDQRALPTFLQNLPGVTATDSMGYRIEALRVYLEHKLGD